jgi:hypothetical protein
MESWAGTVASYNNIQDECEFDESECETCTDDDYEACVESQWSYLNAFTGIILTILVLGLLFATCAVSSSILCKLNGQLHAREASELVRSTWRPADGRGADCERLLSRYTSADNTCNCYQPPAAPKLLTIARLSEFAFMGHTCWTFIIYVPLGFMFLNPSPIILQIVIICLIAVSRRCGNHFHRANRVAGAERARIPSCLLRAHSIYACSACAFRLWCVGQPLSQGV